MAWDTPKQFISDTVIRVDMVFDVYGKDSLKASIRQKRGKGTRRHVEGKFVVPSNWQDFPREDKNKPELFHLIAERVVHETGIVIIMRRNIFCCWERKTNGLVCMECI